MIFRSFIILLFFNIFCTMPCERSRRSKSVPNRELSTGVFKRVVAVWCDLLARDNDSESNSCYSSDDSFWGQLQSSFSAESPESKLFRYERQAREDIEKEEQAAQQDVMVNVRKISFLTLSHIIRSIDVTKCWIETSAKKGSKRSIYLSEQKSKECMSVLKKVPDAIALWQECIVRNMIVDRTVGSSFNNNPQQRLKSDRS